MPREGFLWHEVTVNEDGVITEGTSPFDLREADNEVWATVKTDEGRIVVHGWYVWRPGSEHHNMGFAFIGIDCPRNIVAWAFNNPPPPYKGGE